MAWTPRHALTALAATLLGLAPMALPAQEMRSFSSATPDLAWALPVGAGDAPVDEVDGISVDADGNTVITGIFRGSLTLGGETFAARGPGDIFLASIAPGGGVRWVRRFGGSGNDNAFDVTTDGAGNIILSGWFAGEVDFGGQTVRSAGSQDQFLAKFSPAGELIWVRRYGGTDGDGGNEVAVSRSGEIAVAVITNGAFSAGGRTYAYGGGRRDSLVMRLSPEGEVRWVVQANGPGTERIRAITISDAGEVIVGFQYQGELRMGGRSLSARGGWDGAVARLDPDGGMTWLAPVGSAEDDGIRGVAVGPGGEIYASGIVGGAGVLLNRDIPRIGGAVDFVARVTPGGDLAWVLSMAGPGPRNNGGEIVADARGVIVSSLVTGRMTVRLNRREIGTFETGTRRPTSYVAGFTHEGQPRFLFHPAPGEGRSGALGDVLSVSPDGRWLAQALRFRGSLSVSRERMTTQSDEGDSAVLLIRLNGA